MHSHATCLDGWTRVYQRAGNEVAARTDDDRVPRHLPVGCQASTKRPSMRRSMRAWLALRHLLRALVVSSGSLMVHDVPAAAASSCPSAEILTLWGRETLVCSGHGSCNATTGKCTCQTGDVYGAAWQVAPANIRASHHQDCSGVKAKAPSLALHRLLLATTFTAQLACCWRWFGPTAAVSSRSPRALPFAPWRLPQAAGLAATGTVFATVLSSLLAGADCNCFWVGNFHNYKTISGLAMHPPMTVVTPVGALISTTFLIAATCAAITWASTGRPRGCYTRRHDKARFALFAFNALFSAFWGMGVNVYFNESWDHESHIQLSGLYFVSACLNNLFLLTALWPVIKMQYPHLRVHQSALASDRRVCLAFHSAWISIILGLLYWATYRWKDKPTWSLGVFEHGMSIFQAISFGTTLSSFMRDLELRPVAGVALDAMLLPP